jgi:hypothetical protein
MGQQPASTARGCDELFQIPGLAWRGSNGTMTLEQLASYVAPVLWFSPDEPTLQRRSGQDIRIPTTLPFEPTTNAPVMYYQVTTIDGLPGEKADTLQPDRSNKGQSIVDFDRVTALRIKYIAYFPRNRASASTSTTSSRRRFGWWWAAPMAPWRETGDTCATPSTT